MLGASGRAFSKRTVFVKYLVTLSLFTLVIATYSLLMRYVLYAEAKDALISSQQARIEIFSVKLEKRADELLAMVQLLENNEYIQSYLQSPDEVKKSLIAKSWMDFLAISNISGLCGWLTQTVGKLSGLITAPLR